MRIFVVLFILVLGIAACQTTSMNPPSINTPIPTIPLSTEVLTETATPSISSLTGEPAATPTSTLLPDNVIRVDTFEQEVYPFVENGKYSFAKARAEGLALVD